ncbi:MAG: site-2 protease family protein [Myxococcota bacterium]
MPVVDTLVAVIPLLGLLIVVHELGHFLVAKACGVRVLKFSIGFGAPIGIGRLRARWERNGTEYVIGWIPLGGFVRMLGEAMPGDDPDAAAVPVDARPDEFLDAKSVWQKLAVVFAGPAMNLLLPIVCLLGILWVGFPRPAAIVGSVEVGSPAEAAGIRVGDRIVAVDGEPVGWWDEVVRPLQEKRSPAVASIEVDRGGERETIPVALATQKTRDRFGAVVDTGWIGVSNRRQAALVGVPDADSEAARAGLRSGDLVVAVGETEIEDWESLRAAQARAVAEAQANGIPRIVWTVERAKTGEGAEASGAPAEGTSAADGATAAGGADARSSARADAKASAGGAAAEAKAGGAPAAPETEKRKIAVPLDAELAAMGLIPATILVGYVAPDKPAAEAGLRANDLVLFVDGDPIGSFESFVSRVQTSGGRPLDITYSRAGRVEHVTLAAREETVPGLYEIEGLEEKVYQIGLGAAVSTLPGAIEKQRLRNPVESVPRAVEMAWAMTTDYLEGLGKLFTGEVGTDKLAGPIGIARIARKSLDQGWLDYLSMMMVISINLGFLNLLPIPILDGGQAVLYSIEGIKRAPLSLRTKEIATSVGFAVIALLMGRAFWNDLTPFWLRFVSWLSSS